MRHSYDIYREKTGDYILTAWSPALRCMGVIRLRRLVGVQAVLRPLRHLLSQRPNRARVQEYFRGAKAWAAARGERGLH